MYTHTVTQYSVGGYDKNFSYVVADTHTRAAAIIDPSGDVASVLKDIQQHGCTISEIWLTHTDIDHHEGIPTILSTHKNITIHVHEKGVEKVSHYTTSINTFLDGATISIGETAFVVIGTPGHTPDSVCFFRDATDTEAPLLLSGDTLFVGGCGKISKESTENMFSSLQKLKQLPDKTILFPGHDYGENSTSTLGHEKAHNPYLTAHDIASFTEKRFS